MADISDHHIMQQNQLLREIANEIRAGRSDSAGGPVQSAGGGIPGRPSSTFMRSQMAADQFLSDKWDRLGWGNAYRSEIRSSLMRDAIGAAGIMPAPNTMTQLEYQQFAAEGLGLRAQTMAGSLLAPGYTGQVNAIGDEIFRMSPRFIRAGSASAGILGTGFDRSVSRDLARQIGTMAAGDLRLSGSDMHTIVAAGGRSGQFDFAKNSDDFIAKLRELADVTGELTRTTRMSVSEMAQTMGALRQFGMVDVADQRRAILGMSATARVAGLSMGEMTGMGASAIQAGFGAGIGREASLGMIQSNIMMARAAERSGVLNSGIMALGGGAQGVAQSITQAQMSFAGSQAGRFAMLGGLGGAENDVFRAALAGISGTQGTLTGIFGAQRQAVEQLAGLDEGAANRMHLDYVRSQLRLMGIRDMTSQGAQDAAFSMTRGQMGDAAALTFSRMNFSAAGQLQRDRSELARISEMRRQESAAAYDDYYMQTSPLMLPRRIGARFQQSLAGMYDSIGGFFDPGQSGFFGMGGRFQAADDAIRMGAMPDQIGAASIIAGLNSPGGQVNRQLVLSSLGSPGAGTIAAGMAAGAGLGYASGVAGMKLGAMAGSFIPGVGTAIGAVVGGGIGLIGGYAMGRAGAHSVFGYGSQALLKGDSAEEYLQVLHGVTVPKNAAKNQARAMLQGSDSSGKSAAIFSNPAFMELMQRSGRGNMDIEESRAFVDKVTAIAADADVDASVVTQMLQMTGSDIGLADAFTFNGNFENANEAIEGLLAGSGLKGVDFNFATSEAAGGMAAYLKAMRSGDAKQLAQAKFGLREMGVVKASAFDQLRENFTGMARGDQDALIQTLQQRQATGGSREINRVLGTGASFIEGLISQGSSGARREAAMQALRGTEGDRRQLLDIFTGGGQGIEGSEALMSVLRGSDSRLVQDMLRLGGMDLTNMTADRIASQFEGISTDTVSQLRSQMEKQGVDEKMRPEQLKRALLLQQLSDNSIREEDPTFNSEDAKITQSLERTAGILDRITTKLGGE